MVDLAFDDRPRARARTIDGRARIGSQPEILDEIARPELDLVCWERRLPALVDARLDAWAARGPAEFDRVLPADDLDLWPATEGLDELLRGWLVTDLSALVGRFAVLSSAPRIRVFFGAVRTDRCRKFHVDYLRLRMISTYRGLGTEWLPESGVDRLAMEAPPECAVTANRAIVRSESSIRRASAGDVLLLKGAGEGRGAVHRSPPIEAQSQLRVVLIASTVPGS